jgi:hypothetical protein
MSNRAVLTASCVGHHCQARPVGIPNSFINSFRGCKRDGRRRRRVTDHDALTPPSPGPAARSDLERAALLIGRSRRTSVFDLHQRDAGQVRPPRHRSRPSGSGGSGRSTRKTPSRRCRILFGTGEPTAAPRGRGVLPRSPPSVGGRTAEGTAPIRETPAWLRQPMSRSRSTCRDQRRHSSPPSPGADSSASSKRACSGSSNSRARTRKVAQSASRSPCSSFSTSTCRASIFSASSVQLQPWRCRSVAIAAPIP